jgi:hypothetical protein
MSIKGSMGKFRHERSAKRAKSPAHSGLVFWRRSTSEAQGFRQRDDKQYQEGRNMSNSSMLRGALRLGIEFGIFSQSEADLKPKLIACHGAVPS